MLPRNALTYVCQPYKATCICDCLPFCSPDCNMMQFLLQVHSSAAGLKLITFDADGTLYADGAHMEHDSKMISHIINLMRSNVHVAIVTAAGYPGQADKFEQRVAGLTATFRKLHLPQHIMDRSACLNPPTCYANISTEVSFGTSVQ